MSDMSSLIKIHGSLVTIFKKSTGASDEYGDPDVTWTAEEEKERVWIHSADSFGRNPVFRTEAGRIDASAYVGLLLPDTAVVTGAVIEDDEGRRFEVGKIVDAELFGVLLHREARLSLLEEGI